MAKITATIVCKADNLVLKFDTSVRKELGTEQTLFYNMAGAKRNGATTFIELIRGGSKLF